MNVTIFGATGGTGHFLVQKSLAAGHTVTALVRDPAKFALRDRCRVVTGDAREPAPVCNAIRGAHAVFSTLGAKSPFEKSDLLARAVPQIVTAMESENIRRLIVLGAGGWQPGALDLQTGLRRWLFDFGARTLLRYPIEAQQAQEASVIPSPLDWTIVAPSRLSNAKGRGEQRVRLNTNALPPAASQIARADVADVMFRALEESAWLRQRVYATW
jgi:putative NADH-flavin reductase